MEGVEAAVGEGVFDGSALCVGMDVSVIGMTSFEGIVGAETVLVVQAPCAIKMTKRMKMFDPRVKRKENRLAAIGKIFMRRIYQR